MTSTTAATSKVSTFTRRLVGDRAGAFAPIWVATAVLFAVCAVFAPTSLSQSALLTMLPYAAVLAVAGLGQTLVIQQRGIDMSVPACISLGAAIVANNTTASGAGIAGVIVLSILAAGLVGVLNGLVIFRLNVTPLIATLAVNVIVLGFTLWYSNGRAGTAPPSFHEWAIGTTLGVPRLFIIAVVVAVVLAWVVRRTILGRRLVGVGSGPEAARVIGIRTTFYRLGAYAVTGGLSGLCGVMLAGYLSAPAVFVGNDYLLASVAAAVLGGALLSGGIASYLSTFVAAIFLSQLNILLQNRGAPFSVQLMVQAAAIALAIGTKSVLDRVRSRRAAGALSTATEGIAEPSISATGGLAGHTDTSPGDEPSTKAHT